MFPPHLPPPSSSLEWRRLKDRLKIIIVASLVGLLSGAVGAIVAFSWWWPLYPGGGNIALYSRGPAVGGVDDATRRQIEEHVVSIYKKLSTTSAGNFLSSNDWVGEGAVVGSDGWIALALARERPTAGWRLLLANGSLYGIERFVADERSGVLYVKAGLLPGVSMGSAGEWRPFPLAVNIDAPVSVVMVAKASWRSNLIDEEITGAVALPTLDSAPRELYRLNEPTVPGSLVVTPSGQLAGLARPDGLVIAAGAIELVLPTVLSRAIIQYPTLGVEGWFDDEQPLIIAGKRVRGFVVTRVIRQPSKLQRGDIIEEINGVSLHPGTLRSALGGEAATVTVRRGSVEQSFQTPIVKL